MRNTINGLRVVLVAAFAFTICGCNDSLLDQVNTNTVSSGNFWQSPQDFETAVNGMFHPITNTFFWGRIIHTGALLRSDAHNIRPFGVNTAMSTLQGTPGVARWGTELWQEPWKAIFRANAIIENMSVEAVPDETQRNGLLGQAYFMRAFSHWYLLNLFGNIPLVTSTPQDDADFFPSQASQDAVWNQIIEDLTQAENLLPQSWEGGNIGRPTSGAASALKGKSFLYQGNWAEASANLRKVIDGGQYSLLPAENYEDNFGFQNENNAESVFELQYLGIQAFAWGVDVPGVGTMGNFHIDYAPPSKSPDQSHYINQWVLDVFEANSDVVRRNATIAYDYPGATGYGGTDFVTDFADDIAQAQEDGMAPLFTRKYAGLDVGERDDVDFLGTNVGNNWRIIRYADVLLMMAEALNNQDRTSEAEAYINQVRMRAGIEPLAGLSRSEMEQAIIDERVMELTGEGHRFFDLVRWGLADDYLGANSLHGDHPKSLSGGVFQSNRDEYLWIPVSELSANSNLVQNQGY